MPTYVCTCSHTGHCAVVLLMPTICTIVQQYCPVLIPVVMCILGYGAPGGVVWQLYSRVDHVIIT